MDSIEKIIEILVYRKHSKLAKLLVDSEYDITESSSYGNQYNSTLATVNIYSPLKYYDRLVKISHEEREEILKAFHVPYPIKSYEIEINYIEFFVHPDKPILEEEKNTIQQNEIETTFWRKDYFRLFISHSSKIKSEAKELSKKLKRYAITGFVAHDDIEPTKEWRLVIEDALISCNGIVALLNTDFQQSRWTDQEIGICYGLRKTIIPLRMGVDPYGFMGKYQGIQGKNKSMADIALEILSLLLRKRETNVLISKAIIHKFLNSSNFATAKSNTNLLESITHIDEQLLNLLRNAEKENNQIKHSFGVPQRLQNVIRKWEKELKV